jgi:NAD(P)H-dependent FMN reductase
VARLIRHLPTAAATSWIILAKLAGYASAHAQIAALFLTASSFYAVRRLSADGQSSPIHKGMAFFTAGASISVWIGSGSVWPARHPAAALYAVLFLVAVLPPLLGREAFTTYFARQTTPPAVWKTDIFLAINRHLTALSPGLLKYRGLFWETLFEALIPAALMLGLGVPANRLYPGYYQRRLGIRPAGDSSAVSGSVRPLSAEVMMEDSTAQKERQIMGKNLTIVAVNGSPHAGFGSTAMMIEMLRPTLAENGFSLEVINLCEQDIDYCIGCAVCMEKGRCWIPDDHAGIVERLLAADGIILASPVYFLHVTAQMKTFLDRSLAFGHKPRPSWKPGLAVSVSAGYGETRAAEYLESLLRVYGAFGVGRFTALSTGPGEFLGKPAVEARARDLALDLAQAVKGKRRYPASDSDLIFYQFMGALVRDHRDSIMKDDFEHWKKQGLYEGFETYIQQERTRLPYDPEMRKSWLQEMIARRKSRRAGKKSVLQESPAPSPAAAATTCREMLQSMPLGFDPSAAPGLETVYQFEISGDESFTAHLKISAGACSYHDGPSAMPAVVIQSPARVWLAVSRGELDGQQAFMAGKYKVEGDLSLLLKLRSLFKR